MKQRLKFSLKYALPHLIISGIIALISAWLVYGLLYTFPLYETQNVSSIFLILLIVDVVCGPILTFILAAPLKQKKELFFDISLIAIIQIGALCYGLHSLYNARPVFIAFEADRFFVVTRNQIDDSTPNDNGITIPTFGIEYIGVRIPQNDDETWELLEMAEKNQSPRFFSSWWVPLSDSKEQILKKAKPLHDLKKGKSADHYAYPTSSLYLPLIANNQWLYSIVLNQDTQPIGWIKN